MRTTAVLPVKRFALAKQRLEDSLPIDGRRALAAAMVADVLDALADTAAFTQIVVVTNEDAVQASARAAGAIVIADEHESGQSPAAAAGVTRARHDGAERVLLLPGDCPALDPRELEQLLSSHADDAVVIVPDRHGTGTNALLLAPPEVIAPSFGPGSRTRHEALADAAGARWSIASPTSLLLDIDTRADLGALRQRLATDGVVEPGRAVRTRAWLQDHRVAPAAAPR